MKAQSTILLFTGLMAACSALEPTVGHNQHEHVTGSQGQPEVAVEFPESAAPDPEPDVVQPLEPRGSVFPAALQSDETFRLELREKSVAEAIHMIAEFGGVNIYLDPSLTETIDASFPNVRLQDALQVILDQNQLELVEDPPGIFWVVSNDASTSDRAMFRAQSINLSLVEPLLQAMVGEGTVVVVDATQNLVIVNGVRSDIDLIADYLEAADRLKRQVLIEARLVEVTLGERFELGVTAALNNRTLNGNPITFLEQFTTQDISFTFDFSSGDGDLNATIQALQQYVGLDLISSPRIAAVNNSAASIEIVTEVPYIQTTNTTSTTVGAAGASSFQEVQFKEAGVILKVTPTIQEDGMIEMLIEQELSEVADFFEGIPVLDTRTLNSTLQVKDRHTLVIGGLMQDSIRKTDRGIPLLMDLPLVGRLFKSDEDTADKRELVLFLTPTIMAESEAEQVTERFREVFRTRRQEIGMERRNGKGEVHR